MSRADIERVVQPDRLLEQVRQRQQRHDPVVHRRDDAMERLDRGDDVVVGQHHALRRAGRAAREDELEDLVGRRAGPRPPGGPPSPAGTRDRRPPARRHSASTVVVGKSARPASRGSGASRPVPSIRCRAPRRADDRRRPRPPTCAGRAARTRAGRHRPVVRRGRSSGVDGLPGEDPVARLEVEGAQAPGRDPGPPVELAIVHCVVDPSSRRIPSACRSP